MRLKCVNYNSVIVAIAAATTTAAVIDYEFMIMMIIIAQCEAYSNWPVCAVVVYLVAEYGNITNFGQPTAP